MHKLSLIVMAAGKGTRYGGLKQIDPVGPSGESILDYSVYDAINAGFTKIIFVISSEIDETFRAFMSGKIPDHVEAVYVHQDSQHVSSFSRTPPQRSKPWGTAHAIVAASPTIHEPFAIVNGDDFYGRQSFQQIAEYLTSGQESICMVGFNLSNTLSVHGSVKRGVCVVNEDDSLVDIVEVEGLSRLDGTISYDKNSAFTQTLIGNEIVSMNMWGLQPHVVDSVIEQWAHFLVANENSDTAEFYIPSAINQIISTTNNNCHVIETSEKWFGVTYKEDKARVTDQISTLVELGTYPADLWKR